MNSDDIIFAPIGMAQDEKDFLWELVSEALETTFDNPVMEEFKKQFFDDLDELGPICFADKNEIRKKLYDR